MLLEFDDDGVLQKVNEEDLIYVDKNELDELVNGYKKLMEEHEQLENEYKTLELQYNDMSVYRKELKQEISKLKEENKELEEKRIKALMDYNGLGCEYEGLEERNKRQAKQLDKLYKLIEKQDWDSLTSIIQEFKECEEQLQKEWETY